MKRTKAFPSDVSALSAIGVLLAFSLSSAAVQYTDLDQWMLNSYARIIATALITMAVCVAAFKNRRTLLIFASIPVAGLVAYAFLPSDSGIKMLIAEEAPVFFSWLADFIFHWEIGMEMPETYVYVMTVSITALVTMAVYFSVVKRLLFWPVFMATVALFTAQWVVTREVNKIAFYIAFAVILILYLLYVRKMRKSGIAKTGRRVDYLNLDKFIFSAVPVVMVALLVTMMIPKSPKPIEWKWLDDRIKYRDANAYKAVDYKSYDHFSLAMAGFSSEPGRPGGPVIPDYSHVLDVYSDEILYLRGESWPYFNGMMWGSQSDDVNYSETMTGYGEYDAERKMLLEAVYGWRFMELGEWLASGGHKVEGTNPTLPGPDFSSVTGSHLLPEWFKLSRASVAYKGVETKTLFSPMNSMITDTEGLSEIYIESDATLDTEERIRLNTFVNFDYLSLDRDNENYLETVRKSRNGLYEEIYSHLYYITRNSEAYENIIIESTMHDTLADLFELYIEAETNNWRYTAVPESMPSRVSVLAREITRGIDSDYDKVKSIEEYFNDGFTYTLNAEAPPAGRDFTDWFLFDYKKGYCTYYATAMSMMVRSIGLPTRYVEGFVTPAVASEGDRYTVLNSNAHAWVEVYFEGVGWVNFEPTPPFAAILNKEDGAEDISIGEDMLENPDMEDYMEELGKYENMPAFGTGDGYGGDSGKKAWVAILAFVGAWLTACLAVTLIRKIFFNRINSVRRFRQGYFTILRIVRIKGFKRDEDETLMELAGRIDDAYYMAHVSMKQLTSTYYEIIYSDKDIPVEKLKEMEIFYREFRKEFNSEVRFPEWMAYRILFPVI